MRACNVVNGGFEKDTALPAIGYKYMSPAGWGGKGTVVIKSRNGPWGGLASFAGHNFLGIQSKGSFLQQTLTGLVAGQQYAVKFAAANRPGAHSGQGMGSVMIVIWVKGEERFLRSHTRVVFVVRS